MPSPALNDDVLLNVLSYLHGRDALHVALCSKHLHDLAMPRVPAVATCNSPSDLPRLYNYMLTSLPQRSHALEDLTISLFTFDYPVSVGFSDYWEFSQAPLIGTILAHAPRLRHLTLERLHPCLIADPCIPRALAALGRLVSADFATVSDWTWTQMPPLSASLRILRLSYFWHEDDNLGALGETKTLPPLLGALAPLSNLHTLELWNFDPPPSGHPGEESSSGPPRMSLPIRDLRLTAASPSALELVEHCPHLSSLEFSLAPGEQHLHPLHDGPRWHHLRRLMLSSHTEIGRVLHRVGKVDSVRVPHSELVVDSGGDGEAQVADLLRLIRHTDPESLSLDVTVEDAPMTFWERVSALASRLQILDLRVSLAALSLKNKNWLDNISDALRPLSLVYLSVVVSKTPTVRSPPSRLGDEMEIDSEPDMQHHTDAKELDEYRAFSNAMAALPEWLAAAIPSLQYVTIAGEANEANLTRSPMDQNSDPRLPRPLLSYGQRPLEGKMTVRYWQVMNQGEDGSTRRGLKELSASEGERIQAHASNM